MMLNNLNRKAIALAAAIVVWIFVNQSITETKTVPNVPIKVINLPDDKTIAGLLPNGYISQRIPLTISGTKDVVQELDQGDLEVHIDASSATTNDWVVQITKKNIVSLNPNLDLLHHITIVDHPELVLKLSKLITDKVPVFVKTPIGQPPSGYEYLDVWPEYFTQTISGPEEEIESLKNKGLKLTLDLSKISKEELDALKYSRKQGHNDEISYPVPNKWKIVPVPFRDNAYQKINDPEAEHLRIDFLRKRLNPIGKEIPVTIYYPLKTINQINPNTLKLAKSSDLNFINDIAFFSIPLYAKDVSHLFLDIIRDHLEIVIAAAPKSDGESLHWSVELINSREMEDTYVAYVIAHHKTGNSQATQLEREDLLRKRFKEFLQKFALYTANGEKLNLVANVSGEEIHIKTE